MDGLFVFLIGISIGSFLNVLIDRLPVDEDIMWSRSHCDYCKKKLRWYELIPLVSYILQSGRCRRCRKHLSLQYPVVEASTGLGIWGIFMMHLPIHVFVALAAVYCLSLVLFAIDMKTMILPDTIMTVLFLVVLYLLFTVHRTTIWQHIWSGAIAGLSFLLLWILTKGRGLGFGDVKLSVLLGLFLGYPGIIIGMYIAFLTGAVVGVILILTRKVTMKSRIAFGPFLILGALCAYVGGDQLWRIWVNLL